MRKKNPKLIISFESNTHAIALKAACGEGLGRVIPLPTQLGISCGLAWCAEPADRATLEEIMRENAINPKEIRIVELYF
ncbi:MAG: DUF3343 domain-containing protein [Clostridiales bacterium]|jgi:hypothetical protein|nr:DUF3343 domain-containing protein [Clostridiales bacterium]